MVIILIVLILLILLHLLHSPMISGGGGVRRAELKDVETIKKLADKYILDVYTTELKFNKDAILEDHSIDEVKEIALDKTNPTFVYDDGGIVLGFISVFEKDEKLHAIKLFSVDQTQQGKGIGEQLMKRALAEFNTDYYLKVNWYNPMKEQLLKYYSKFGFAISEVKKDEWIKMVKKL
jgi:GNAT superfamily N-acetyltransferase